MNSVLQQLFMIPSFRKGLLEVEQNSEKQNEQVAKPVELLYFIKLLFGTLRDSKRESYSAAHLCSLIKDCDGKPLSIYNF